MTQLSDLGLSPNGVVDNRESMENNKSAQVTITKNIFEVKHDLCLGWHKYQITSGLVVNYHLKRKKHKEYEYEDGIRGMWKDYGLR